MSFVIADYCQRNLDRAKPTNEVGHILLLVSGAEESTVTHKGLGGPVLAFLVWSARSVDLYFLQQQLRLGHRQDPPIPQSQRPLK